MYERRPLPRVLNVFVWDDPSADDLGTNPTRYLYFGWLPLLGPTATMAYVLLRSAFGESDVVGYEIESAELARSLGIGPGTEKNARLPNAVARLVRHDLAQWHGQDRLDVRRWPLRLSHGQLSALPRHNLHALWAVGAAPRPPQ